MTISVLQLREVLHPDIFAKIIRPQVLISSFIVIPTDEITRLLFTVLLGGTHRPDSIASERVGLCAPPPHLYLHVGLPLSHGLAALLAHSHC